MPATNPRRLPLVADAARRGDRALAEADSTGGAAAGGDMRAQAAAAHRAKGLSPCS